MSALLMMIGTDVKMASRDRMPDLLIWMLEVETHNSDVGQCIRMIGVCTLATVQEEYV